MTSAIAIQKFFGTPEGFCTPGTEYQKVNMAEMKSLRASMPSEEWDALGKSCAAALGAEWEAPKAPVNIK